jgi:probable rRNA maturation factor
MAARIDIVIEDALWREEGRGFSAALRKAARAALLRAERSGGLTILLAGDERLAGLNAQFRGKSGPTNVLSFPGPDDAYLGDVAIAHGTAAREALAEHKTLRDHAIHLAVHGVLHLAGYDHVTARDARVMEPLEVDILSSLGIADPYRAQAAAAHSD